MIASRGTWYSCFAAGFACYSWWLLPPRRLGAARIVERRVVILSGSDRGDCEGFLTFPGRERKGTLVDCSWLVWSSSCVDCVAPYWGFGVWSQLAREPSSEWIATTKTSLSASKWTSVKNRYVIIWFRGDWFLFLWLIGSFLDSAVYPSCSISLHYRKLVVKLFSIASRESLLVWLVWLFS